MVCPVEATERILTPQQHRIIWRQYSIQSEYPIRPWSRPPPSPSRAPHFAREPGGLTHAPADLHYPLIVLFDLPFVPVPVTARLHAGQERGSSGAAAAGGRQRPPGGAPASCPPLAARRDPRIPRGGSDRPAMRSQSAKFKFHMVSRSGQQIQTDWTPAGVPDFPNSFHPRAGPSAPAPVSVHWLDQHACQLRQITGEEEFWKQAPGTDKLRARTPMAPDSNPTCHSHVQRVLWSTYTENSDHRDCPKRRIQEQDHVWAWYVRADRDFAGKGNCA
ncbi:hypothetical protein SEVIR_6G221650v4 [Setaria viridis]